jgi:hypothetical protein
MADLSDNKEARPGNLDFLRLSGDTWQALQEFDDHIKQYHLSLQVPGLDYFQEAIRLLADIIRGIAEPTPGWHPKFTNGGPVAQVLALSAAGSLRSLLASHKLLLDGYFMEAHVSIRMVEQWLEVPVIVEADPSLANKVLEEGVKRKYLRDAGRKSPEFDRLLQAMRNTRKQLSQRGHVTKTAIRFIAPSMGLVLAGIGNDEMLNRDGLALAEMAMNVVRVLIRHFKTVPSHWNSRFHLTSKRMKECKSP